MKGLILLDTSVWIEHFKERVKINEEEIPFFATCLPVYQEVLQGIRLDAQKRLVTEAFSHLKFLCDPLEKPIFERAVELFRFCRKNGYTIRSSADCLIAAIAEKNEAILWTRDRDFEVLKRFGEFEVRWL